MLLGSLLIRILIQVRELHLFSLRILLTDPSDPRSEPSEAIRTRTTSIVLIRQLLFGIRMNLPGFLAVWTMRVQGIPIHQFGNADLMEDMSTW
jgi:hypothetical protein